jgi:hypothetical protein
VSSRSLPGAPGEHSGFFADGEIRKLGKEFNDHSLNLYGEYGVTDDWTVVYNGRPFGTVKVGDDSATYVGAQSFGVRRALAKGDMKIAIELRYVFSPAVGDEPVAQGVSEAEAEADREPWFYAPTIAGHGVDGELQLGKGLSFGWWTAAVGARHRTASEIGTALTATAQLGIALSDTVNLSIDLSMEEPLDEVEVTNVSGAGRTRFFGNGLAVSWWVTERMGLTTGFGGAFYASSNAASPALSFGIELR